MVNLKKICVFILSIMVIFGINSQYARGLPNGLPRDHEEQRWSQSKGRPSDGKIGDIKISGSDLIGSGSKTIGDKSMGILHLPQKADYRSELAYILALIQIAVNRTLGMLSCIALVIILYNGFLVLTSGSDTKNAEKGKKGISTAVIALAGIALSRLIISIMIRFITHITSLNI